MALADICRTREHLQWVRSVCAYVPLCVWASGTILSTHEIYQVHPLSQYSSDHGQYGAAAYLFQLGQGLCVERGIGLECECG